MDKQAVQAHEGRFVGYDKGNDADRVAELFEETRGYRPREVHDGGTIWLAGPVGEGAGRRSLAARAEAAQREMTPERARQLAMELGG
jgi:hypothetical protein